MTNDFSKIDAQDETSRAAQLTTEELTEANSFYDELNAKLDVEIPMTPEGLQVNDSNWNILSLIHQEIAPIMEEIKHKEELLETLQKIMGYAILMTHCCNCGKTIACNPVKVPSIRVNGTKEPLCRNCFNEWNKIHRTSQGLPPVELHPDAYGACQENELS